MRALLALVILAACSVGEPEPIVGLGGSIDSADALRLDGVEAGAALVAQVEVDAHIDATAATLAEEVARAELVIGAVAGERGPDGDVHELAKRAIRSHQVATAELDTLRAVRGIAVRETTVSVGIRVEAQAEADALATMALDDLDLAYTARQVRGSARAAEVYRRLANRVEDAPLRAFLDRQVIAAGEQLMHAVDVYDELHQRRRGEAASSPVPDDR